MKILTYNVNGIRAVMKKNIVQWIQSVDADVICLQETKAMRDQFEVHVFEELGYHFHLFPAERKGYSGVAILSKKKANHVVFGMGIEKYDKEGRMIRCDYDDLSVMSVYMPSGASKIERQDFKLAWLKDFYKYIGVLKKEIPNLIIGGDFNLCHQALDIHDPIRLDGYPGFTPDERAWMTNFIRLGFADSFRYLHPDLREFSWWSYRSGARIKNLGWRIDYVLLSEPLLPSLKSCKHLSHAKHSDHCPVLIELDKEKEL